MPVERISRGFKDVSMSFEINPISSDLIATKDETAIARSVRNLVLTRPGERFFNPNLGSRVYESLFDNVDDISASIVEDDIRDTVDNYEPRVKLVSVKATPDYQGNAFDVVITYNIIGIDASPQQLAFALQPTR
jgi:phage baseplate assembly protein W|tara:strand:- start:195 stop:596 length:402 start_codon:yes stop_codon:yes gene_type:complete